MIKKREIYLILDNIRSRENIGSIFRTADGAGVKKIYLCGITPAPSAESSKFQISSSKQIRNSTFVLSLGRGKFEIQNSDKIHKTALGAENYVSWEYRAQTWKVLRELKVESVKLKVIGLEKTKNSKDIFKYKFPENKKIVLVVGNEVKGLSPKILKYCDKVAHIPMYGKKESLNVSVAAGIGLYAIISKIKN